MKKLSATKVGTSALPDLVFFTDRDLGKRFPAILREAGLRVEPYHEHFSSPTVSDEEWLRFVGEKGWVAISHDVRQTVNPVERDAAMRSGVKIFYVIGSGSYPALTEPVIATIDQIRRMVAKHPDAFLAKISRAGGGLPARVKMHMTYAQWLKNVR